jgi:hypothetical protein
VASRDLKQDSGCWRVRKKAKKGNSLEGKELKELLLRRVRNRTYLKNGVIAEGL